MAHLLAQYLLSDYLVQVNEKSQKFGTLVVQGPPGSGLSELKKVLSGKFVCKDFTGPECFSVAEDGVRIFFSESYVELSPHISPDVCVITLQPEDIDSLVDYMITLFSSHGREIPSYQVLYKIYKESKGFPSLVKLRCGELLNSGKMGVEKIAPLEVSERSLGLLKLLEESGFLWGVDWSESCWNGSLLELHSKFLVEKHKGSYRVSQWGQHILETEASDVEIGSLIDEINENQIDSIKDDKFKFRLTLQMALWNSSVDQVIEILSYNTQMTAKLATKNQIKKICELIKSSKSTLDVNLLFQMAEISVELDPEFSEDLVSQLMEQQGSLTSEQCLRLSLLDKRLGYSSHSERQSVDLFESRDDEGSETSALRLFEEGLKLRRQGFPGESVVKLQEACELTLIPSHRAEFLYAMGVSYILEANCEAAISKFEEALPIYTSVNNFERIRATQFNKAVAYENMGEVDYAVSLIEKIMSETDVYDSLSASMHNFIGQIELSQGKYSQAIDRLVKVISYEAVNPSQKVICLEAMALAHSAIGLFEEAEGFVHQMYEYISKFELEQLLGKALYVDLEVALKRKNFARIKVLNKRIKSSFEKIPKKYRLAVLQRLFISEVELFSDSGLLQGILAQIDEASAVVGDAQRTLDRELLAGIELELKGSDVAAFEKYKESLRFAFRKRMWSRLEETVPRALRIAFRAGKVSELDEFMSVLIERCKGSEAIGLLLVHSLKYNHTMTEALADKLVKTPNMSVEWKFLIQKLQARERVRLSNIFEIEDCKLQSEPVLELIELCKSIGVSLLEECVLIQRSGTRNEILSEKQKQQWKASGLFVDVKSKTVFFDGEPVKALSKSPLLFKLLSFFVENFDSSHTKEEIISYVWREKYDPQIHDSLIYVSLHRLKKIFSDQGVEMGLITSFDDNYRLNSEVRFSYVTDRHQFSKCLSQRQLWVLNYLKYNNKINNQSLCKLLDIAPRTALRDLAQMVETGYLVTEGKGKSLKYVLPA